jgi:CheY-like chemotaxis protein
MHTLFIVDDDMVFQRIMKMTLIKYPVFKHVHYFTEGKSLLTYLIKNKNDFSNLPDVIFLDLSMPELDGWGVLDAMQHFYSSLCKKIAVYIVTVSVIAKDKERAATYGFVEEFISKPLYGDKIMAIKNFKHIAR